jgi:predicted nucleic acid-binding protein
VVIIDSDILITAYKQRNSPERAEVSRLVEVNEAATVGIVLAEVLRGARAEAEFEEMTEELLAMRYIDGGRPAWLLASRILFDLKRAGNVIPLPDAIIAAEALLSDSEVYGHDEHFRRIQGLRLH